MPPRSIATASITFGLVSIPVRLFPATSSKAISFNLLHAKDNSRIQQKIYCPVDDAIIDRSELVRGYEIEKGRYVTFTDQELKNLEARGDHAIEISEFIPIEEVDPVFFESPFLLGCEPTSARAYRLLAKAMDDTRQVAVARYTMRGKEHVVLIRNYKDGLMLHTMHYGDEVRGFGEIDHGADAPAKPAEVDLAKRLIGDLTQKKFDIDQYKDGYRERVIEAASQKASGQEIAEPPPEVQRGKVIDLMSALKESLKKRGVEVKADRDAGELGKEAPEEAEKSRAPKERARRRAR
ncbi:MAG: Ku protein [Deltaproteobacteria bacterium]|nr:Ku protein [Deltaproteobacteria bacterium]